MNNNPYFNYYTYPNFQNINFRSVPSSFINGPLRNPIMGGITKNPGLLSRIFAPTSSISAGVTGATKTFSFSNLLNGASKTLNVAKAMNSSDSIKTNDNTTTKKEVVKEENISTNNNGPTFFD